MDIEIRKAKKNDLAAIYDLVVELAIYEKEPTAVTATLEEYHQDFEEGCFEALVAVQDEVVIGMMLYYMTYSTWKGKMLYLEDFVVKNDSRKLGIGQLLYNALLKEACHKKAKLIKWQVLDWNTPAIKFYEKNKAHIEKDWWTCKAFIS